MRYPTVLITVMTCAVALVRPMAAQDALSASNAVRQVEAAKFLSSRISPYVTLDSYLRILRSDFARADANGDGVVSEADITLQTAIVSALSRATSAVEIMVADLDGDGVVTEAELRQKLNYDERVFAAGAGQERLLNAEGQRRIEQRVARIMAADTDKDGRITYSEAIKAAPSYGKTRASGEATISGQILALAPAGKDSVALADLEAAGEAFFRVIDTDQNGTVSSEEFVAWHTKQSR
jgi:Ca2+-binding EF-hand superfamily protein